MNVGLVGLGAVGSRIGAILAQNGDLKCVYNRTISKAIEFSSKFGIKYAESTGELADQCDLVFTALSDDDAVVQVLRELKEKMRRGSIIVDLSTISPETSIELFKSLKMNGITMYDVPVVGSTVTIERKEATLLVGGPSAQFENIKEILEKITPNMIYVGENGSGLRLKLVNNLLLATFVTSLSEASSLGLSLGIPGSAILELLTSLSTLKSETGSRKLPKIIKREYSKQSSLAQISKDLRIVMKEASSVGAPIPISLQALKLYEMAQTIVNPDFDLTAVAEVYIRKLI